jgi:dihydroxyacetone kinase-like predicted kinase
MFKKSAPRDLPTQRADALAAEAAALTVFETASLAAIEAGDDSVAPAARALQAARDRVQQLDAAIAASGKRDAVEAAKAAKIEAARIRRLAETAMVSRKTAADDIVAASEALSEAYSRFHRSTLEIAELRITSDPDGAALRAFDIEWGLTNQLVKVGFKFLSKMPFRPEEIPSLSQKTADANQHLAHHMRRSS